MNACWTLLDQEYYVCSENAVIRAADTAPGGIPSSVPCAQMDAFHDIDNPFFGNDFAMLLPLTRLGEWNLFGSIPCECLLDVVAAAKLLLRRRPYLWIRQHVD